MDFQGAQTSGIFKALERSLSREADPGHKFWSWGSCCFSTAQIPRLNYKATREGQCRRRTAPGRSGLLQSVDVLFELTLVVGRLVLVNDSLGGELIQRAFYFGE